jgi:hypothetical protein
MMSAPDADFEPAHPQFSSRNAASAVLLAIAVAVLLLRTNAAFAYLLNRCLQLTVAVLPAALLVGILLWLGLSLVPRKAAHELTRTEALLAGGVAAAGILSSGTLLLGLFGWARPWIIWGGLAAAAIVAGYVARRRGGLPQFLRPAWCNEPWTVPQLILAAFLTICLVPIVVSAFAPPLLYDVTEYHLGAYRDYAQGTRLRFVPMPHNFYARFPFPIEALYYVGLLLEAPNDFAPKLINLASVVGLAALFWQWAGRWGVRRFYRLVGVLALLTHPVLLEVSLDAYIDAPVALHVLITFYLLLLVAGPRPVLTPEAATAILPLLAWIAGLTCVVKYTAAQFYVVPLVLVFALPLVRRLAALSWKERLWVAALFLAGPAAWLGKNVLFYANPLEPFFTWLFTPNDAAAMAREKFYVAAHYPQPPWTAGYWSSLGPRLESFGWLLLAPLAGLVVIWRRPGVPQASFVCLASYLLWNMIRYSQDRFLLATTVLVILMGVAVIQQLPSALARTAAVVALLLSAAAGIIPHTMRVAGGEEFHYFANFIASSPSENIPLRQDFYRKNLGALGELITEADRSLPPDACVLFVYEARPYLLHRRAVYNTVFDESQLLTMIRGVRSADEITSRLLARGITHVLVNVEELRRFIDQYATPEQLRQRGIREPMREFPLIRDPEDLYPPFYRSPEWGTLRQPVVAWLRALRTRALISRGHPTAPIFLADLRAACLNNR